MRPLCVAVLSAMLTVVAFVGCSDVPKVKPPGVDGGEGGPPPACQKPAATGFVAGKTLSVGGQPRSYATYVPTAYDGQRSFPLVVVLHGDGGTGAQIRSALDVETASGNGAIFAYPDGQGKTWDTDDWIDGNKDLPFLDALVKELLTTLCADSTRVFVTGHSRGAYMANQLGCWRGGTVRAVASHSGGGPFDGTSKHFDDNGMVACPGSPVPALMIHGDADNVVDIAEGQKSLAYWSYADRCQAGSTAAMPSPCQTQNACTPSPVTFCKIPGLSHAVWPQAPAAIWSFFDALK